MYFRHPLVHVPLNVRNQGFHSDAFAELRKAAIRFVMFPSVRPLTRMVQFDSHWTDFDKI
jgi:hypothetical protein